MRNLKKILALALALVMTLSLMTVANAFNDDADIDETYAEAVEVLSGLEVFKGVEDGSNFAPKQTITRAEVAAIIYRIVTGDVDDTQEGIYADYARFADVADDHWAAGYIGYCANAELVVGDGTNFYPGQTVTGYQALAMILRALGYDQNDEFKGTGWEIRVASTAQQKGILKNINAGTLGTAATREMVAEILFQAIANTNTVYYLTNTMSYQDAGSTLGWQTFRLERLEGVVTANEYADLDGSAPLAAGKTRLDGTVIDYSSELTDIGESRYAYVVGSTVLALADTGLNTVFQTGEGTVINQTNTGMNVSTAEKYLNFGEDATVYTSDWRIEYNLEITAASDTAFDSFLEDEGLPLEREDFDVTYGTVNNTYTYEKVIRAGATISSADYALIQYIFATADYEEDVVLGEVYVGTSSGRDVSDRMSFREFVSEYIDTENDDADFTASDNGEWLKVVDNDGDGVAEYIFLTEFAMSVISRISNSGVYTLAELDGTDDAVSFPTTSIRASQMVTEDELAAGDVVLYTCIDGVYYVDIADMVTETVDARGINSKDETMTCDGTVYEQSHIGYTDETSYYYDVTDAHTEVTYDLYLDHFGYVRLFIESDFNTFMLLTDGYYETDRRDEAFKALYWNVEAGEEQEIDVVGATADDFINVGTVNNNGDRETWRRLVNAGDFYGFDAANNNDYITNIAGYSTTDDGYVLVSAEDSTNRTNYEVQELNVTNDTDVTDRLLRTYPGDRIQTTTNTQYYLVIKATDRFGAEYVADVLTWTGYANAPEEAVLAEDAVAYAVTTDGTSLLYDVASVVVFETEPTADHSTYFVYTHNNYSFNDPDRIEYVWAIGHDEDGAIDSELRVDVEADAQVIHDNGVIQFYEIYDDEDVVFIGSNYAASNIYAGVVSVNYEVSGFDYIQVDTLSGYLRFNPSEIDIFAVDGASTTDAGEYDVYPVDNWDDISVGDRLIVVTDARGNVEYAIAVDMSTYTVGRTDYVYSAVSGLWNDIWTDSIPTDYDALLEDALDQADDAIAANDLEKLQNALAVLNALWTSDEAMADFSADQRTQLANKIAEVEAAIAVLEGAASDEQVADALVAAYQAYRTDPTDTTRAALFAAAVAYDELGTTVDADADAALAAAETLASTIVTNINSASLTSWAGISAAMDLPQLDANAEKLVTWGTPTEAQYNAKVADIAEAAALYNKAYELVRTYDAWRAAVASGLPSEVTSTRAAYEAAFNAITSDDLAAAALLSDEGSYDSFGTSTTTWSTAYNALYGENSTANTDLVNGAVTELTGHTWTAIVGTDLTVDDIEANLLAQVQAVLDAATTDFSGVTVSIPATPGNWATVPTLGTTNSRTFRIVLTAGTATNYVAGNTVSVTNNYSVTSLETAVRNVVDGITYAGGANRVAYENAVKTAIVNAISVLSADEVEVTVILGASTTVGSTLQVSVTVTDELGPFSFTATEVFTA